MLTTLSHRGPDDQGEYELSLPDGRLWFGHRRLSILDLSSAGHQPMHSRDGRLTIIFNGEIYNFLEIRAELESHGYSFVSRSDTEVILAAWDKWGVGSLEHLRGMFAFAIWDRREQCLWLARDRMGEKPLYYILQKDRFIFASEIRALLASEVVERRMDADGLDSYLTFGSVTQPYTLVKDVKCLEAGQCLRNKNGSVDLRTYWSLGDFEERENDIPKKEVTLKVAETLLESFRLCMVSDVPVGLLLSGGVDSTSILALLTRAGYNNLHTFSVIFDSENSGFNEEYWSNKASKQFGSNHSRILIRLEDSIRWINEAAQFMDQPSFDGFNTFVVSRAIANRGFKVAITGQGGDEIFLGYPSRKYFKIIEPLARLSLPNSMLEYSNNFLSVISPLLSRIARHGGRIKNLLDLFREGNPYALAYLAKYSIFNQLDLNKLRGQDRPPQSRFIELRGGMTTQGILSRVETCHYLANTLLRDADQMGMACSVEIRSPYCDYRLVELVAQAPLRYKIGSGKQKPLLVDSVNDELIREIAQRPKQGFVLPIDKWLKNGLHIADPLAGSLGLDRKVIAEVIRRFRAGQDFREYWTLAVLARWAQDLRMLPPAD